MTVCYIHGDVKSHGKSRHRRTDNEKAHEVYLVQILGVEKEIRYAQIFSEASRNHGKQYDPAENQYMVAFDIID